MFYQLIKNKWLKNEQQKNANANNANVCNVNSSSFKYKSVLIGNVEGDGGNGKKEKVKIAVPLRYFSSFWRSLEMSLINCKIELSWIEIVYLLSGGENINDAEAVANAGTAATFKINDAKLHVLVVTLWAEDNVKLSKL